MARLKKDEPKEEAPKKEVSKTKVRIVLRKRGFILVQWDDGVTFQRAWVASDRVPNVEVGDFVTLERVEEWPPFGERWDLLFELNQATPEQLDRELKRKNIWTIEDLQLNPEIAKAALGRVYGLDIVKVLNDVAFKQQATGG